MTDQPDHGDGVDLWAAKVNLQRAERAEAEIVQLTAERDRLRDDCECYEAMKSGVSIRIADLEAERDRLRAALRLCIGQHTGRVWTTVSDADVEGYVMAATAAGGTE